MDSLQTYEPYKRNKNRHELSMYVHVTKYSLALVPPPFKATASGTFHSPEKHRNETNCLCTHRYDEYNEHHLSLEFVTKNL